ncbi:hypothetical protein HXX01_03055 [Candidatus Nomurabacteria bacterium]|nr:hypothetical protein [Candidatus Nomurabacteria bacterium]
MVYPLLSEYDPETSSEGSLDPLGTYTIADTLATRLIPGFRERMRRPRFLTASVVGSVVCNAIDRGSEESDEKVSSYQVYEWYVVQALVNQYYGKPEIVNLPGSEKARDAYFRNLRLNPARYLKTPSVFGFHGVYRTLAKELDILDDYILGEGGERLIRAWEKDQELPGFYDQLGSEGRRFRDYLSWAVKDGIKSGQCERAHTWTFYPILAQKLIPSGIGPREGKVLYELMLNNSTGFRGSIVTELISYLSMSSQKDNVDEYAFYSGLQAKSHGELKDILSAVLAYEAFSRNLINGFEDILYHLSITRKETPFNEFCELEFLKQGSKTVSELYRSCLQLFTESSDQSRFQHSFSDFEQVRSSADFSSALINHHQTVQKNKPPNGKMDWIVQTTGDRWIIRSTYFRKQNFAVTQETFVHAYRTIPLRSFLMDLKKV